MKRKLLCIILLLAICNFNKINAQFKVTTSHLKPLIGNWTGTLTYLDYKSNKPYTMPANIEVSRIGKLKEFLVANIYPNEPKANSTDTIRISKKGTILNNNILQSNKKLQNGNREIITTVLDTDGNDKKQATIKKTYTIGKNIYKVKKEVQFEGTTNWVTRHKYVYTKK